MYYMLLAAAVGIGISNNEWAPLDAPLPLALTGPALVSEPIMLNNPMLRTINDNILEVSRGTWHPIPWAPGEAMLLRLRPREEGVKAFGFWVGPDEFSLLVREGDGWELVTPGHKEKVSRSEIAYFGHEVSGQAVEWTEPARAIVIGGNGPEGIRVRRVRLWEAGCTEMVLQRGERELRQAREFLGWAKKPHPAEEAAVERCTEAIQEVRRKLEKRTAGLLDDYMSLPEPRYALEVIAYFVRRYNRGGLGQPTEEPVLKTLGLGETWASVFYGRPEFEPCIDARIAAQEALWSERPETLAAEAKEVFGQNARFAVSITHGLRKFRRDKPFPEPLKRAYRMYLAREEYEPFQVVVASIGEAVRNVRVRVQWEGEGPHPEVTFRPVGYVETKPDPDNFAEYIGWWPDPLMPPGPVDVAAGETQPVWGTVHATKETTAGEHRGRVIVTADGMAPLECELVAHVFDFDLGFTHLPSLLSLRLDSIKKFYKLDNVSQDIRRRWYAFCLKYRMNPNNIYASGFIPGEEDLDFCVKHGLNAMVMHIQPLKTSTRNSRENVELWISDDNRSFRKVEGDWTLTHDEQGNIVIGNIDVTARYLKVHSLIEDYDRDFLMERLEPGHIVAYDGEQEFTGRVGYVETEDGTQPLGGFGTAYAALDYNRSSLGVDLGRPRHVSRLVLKGSVTDTLERVCRFYDLAKAVGLGDRAYVYGFDEWPDIRHYDKIKRTFDLIRAAAPGIKACSTVVFPVEPITESVDAWCPAICYEYPEYQAARKRGQEVWYYEGGTPYDPFPSHELLNVPAVEARAFFWLAWRYQYTGWLHWELNWWGPNLQGEKRWPEVPWNPARSGIRNGEVGYIYPGPDVTPLPSVRLENMRDGIEDYDYFWILNEAVNKLPDGDPRKARGRKLLQESIMTLCPSRAHFERDPERVLAIHRRLGQAIEDLL